MRTAVFVTYNSVGRDLANGWYSSQDTRILVKQGFIRKEDSGPDIHEKRSVCAGLWREVCAEIDLRELDLFVIYCGKIPTLALSLVAGLPQSKLLFAHCGCGVEPGSRVIWKSLQLCGARWVKTKCGGIDEMRKLFDTFASDGEVTASMTLGDILVQI